MRNRDLAEMSLREFYACKEAHNEYHGATNEENTMSADRLAELGIDGFETWQ